MPNSQFSASVCTLGCRVNQYESECVISEFMRLGFEIKDFGEICDVYVINTCSVTAASDKKSKQMIRRAKKQNKNALIAVCGCFSQNNPEAFKAELWADIVVGTTEKTKIPKLALDILNGIPQKNNINNILVKSTDEFGAYENIAAYRSEKTRAYIKIQDGCDCKCSYCIVPKLRGHSKSREYSHIYDEVKHFDELGYCEVVLTGIEISSYGKDFKDKGFDLIALLEKLNAETELCNIQSIRLSSVAPALINKNFTDRLANLDKIANHFHLSLQSGSTDILHSMRRRYNAETAIENAEYAKKKIKGLNLTADIIVGFPGESEEDFEKSIEMVKILDIYHAHIFKYSKRPKTEAADFADQVSEDTKNSRSKKLSEVCKNIKEKIHKENLGAKFEVIIEDMEGEYYNAKTKNFFDVKIKIGAECEPPKTAMIEIYDYDKDFLYGEIRPTPT